MGEWHPDCGRLCGLQVGSRYSATPLPHSPGPPHLWNSETQPTFHIIMILYSIGKHHIRHYEGCCPQLSGSIYYKKSDTVAV